MVENLEYKIVMDDGPDTEVLGRVRNLDFGAAVYMAAVAKFANRNIYLRQGERTIKQHLGEPKPAPETPTDSNSIKTDFRTCMTIFTALRTHLTTFQMIQTSAFLLIVTATTIFLCGVPFYLIYGLAFQLGEVAGLYKIDDIAVHYFHLGLLGLIVPAIGLAYLWIRRICRKPYPLLQPFVTLPPWPPYVG